MAPPGTVYGGRFVVTMIPGDGIGREVCAAVKTVFSAANVPIDWEEVRVSDSDDLSLALDSLRRNKIGLKGTKHIIIHHDDQASFIRPSRAG